MWLSYSGCPNLTKKRAELSGEVMLVKAEFIFWSHLSIHVGRASAGATFCRNSQNLTWLDQGDSMDIFTSEPVWLSLPVCLFLFSHSVVSDSLRSPGLQQWHPTPVLLPGESHGWRSPVGYSPQSREESDMTSLSLFTLMHWRRKQQPTLVFLPGESQGQKSLVGCHLWGRTESDTTEAT